MANGAEVVLAGIKAKADGSGWLDAAELARMTPDQRDALMFHLLHWFGAGSLPEIRVSDVMLNPRYDSPGCFYSF